MRRRKPQPETCLRDLPFHNLEGQSWNLWRASGQPPPALSLPVQALHPPPAPPPRHTHPSLSPASTRSGIRGLAETQAQHVYQEPNIYSPIGSAGLAPFKPDEQQSSWDLSHSYRRGPLFP